MKEELDVMLQNHWPNVCKTTTQYDNYNYARTDNVLSSSFENRFSITGGRFMDIFSFPKRSYLCFIDSDGKSFFRNVNKQSNSYSQYSHLSRSRPRHKSIHSRSADWVINIHTIPQFRLKDLN